MSDNLRLMQLLVGEPTGGAERFFAKLAIALHQMGVDQSIAILEDTARATELREAGCSVEEFKFGKGLTDLLERRRLQKHTNAYQPTLVLAWMNRAARRMPSGPFTKVARIGGYYRARNYSKCDWIIANSPDLVRHIVEDGWSENRVEMISNFGELEPAPEVSKQSLGIPEKARMLLALGRLHPSKGFDVLIEAMPQLSDDVHLAIAGTGEIELDLKSQVASLNLENRVHFLGWRSDQSALLKACDICVVPSRHEPLSNVVIEAWSEGVPVVATRSEGPSWLIDNGQNGLLVDIDNVGALTDALQSMLSNGEFLQNMANAGHKTWGEQFSKDKVVRQYLDFFKRVSGS